MTNKGIDIQHPKLRGEWAELRFMARAAEHGLLVTKPWGDTARYDFAVEYKGKFLRVQVKSTKYKRGAGYYCNVVADGNPYESKDLDFLAAYVIPKDVWYIIPAQAFKGQTRIGLYPGAKNSKYHCYEEAWQLLLGGKAGTKTSGASAGSASEAGEATSGNEPLPEEAGEETPRHMFSHAEKQMLAVRDRILNSECWRFRR